MSPFLNFRIKKDATVFQAPRAGYAEKSARGKAGKKACCLKGRPKIPWGGSWGRGGQEGEDSLGVGKARFEVGQELGPEQGQGRVCCCSMVQLTVPQMLH